MEIIKTFLTGLLIVGGIVFGLGGALYLLCIYPVYAGILASALFIYMVGQCARAMWETRDVR